MKVKITELGEQTAISVPTIKIVGKETRGDSLKFRINAGELYLLDSIAQDMGNVNRTHVFRYLLNHYADIKKADKIVSMFKVWKQQEIDLDELLRKV